MDSAGGRTNKLGTSSQPSTAPGLRYQVQRARDQMPWGADGKNAMVRSSSSSMPSRRATAWDGPLSGRMHANKIASVGG